MLRRLVLYALLSASCLAVVLPAQVATIAAVSSQIAMFPTEGAAQSHCPSDVVVWLNTKSGIFHEKGMRWYGRTKQGAYVCRKEAIAAGYRDTRNGQ